MGLFLGLLFFWFLVIVSAKSVFRIWSQRRSLQPARYLKEITSVAYYQRLPPHKFESLVMQGLKMRQFTLFGDPCLGRSEEQGYAWKKGKKSIVVYRLEKPLTPADLHEIEISARFARAEKAILFSPFAKAPKKKTHGLEIISGKKMLSWFTDVAEIPIPLVKTTPAEKCECGAVMKDRVSRAGAPLLVCSMYPDCRVIRHQQKTNPPTEMAAIHKALMA